jgi:hypothetical protein
MVKEEKNYGDDNRGVDDYAQRSPERVEDNVRQTRAAMDETLDKISSYFEPRRLANEAWSSLRENLPSSDRAAGVAKQATRNLGKQVGRHPIPSALVGLGLMWLLAEEARSDPGCEPGMGERGREAAAGVAERGKSMARSAGESAQQAAAKAGDSARGMASKAGEGVQHAAAKAGEGAAHMAQRAGEGAATAAGYASHAAGDAARRAASSAAHGARYTADATADAYESRPLLFGALALAAGLAAGIAIPDSRRERRAFGETGEELRSRAAGFGRAVGEEVADAAKQTAVEGVERVSDTVEAHADRAASQAKHQVESKQSSTTGASNEGRQHHETTEAPVGHEGHPSEGHTRDTKI